MGTCDLSAVLFVGILFPQENLSSAYKSYIKFFY